MNKIEFNEVLKLFDIEDIYLYRFNEEVYFWNNLAIYFSGKYYTIISGKIPLIVMNNIYTKFKNNMHGIRIIGLDNIKGSDKYIKKCHIDSKEGLIIFLNEINKYYGENEIDLNDAIASITSSLLNKINPSITTYEWMKNNKEFIINYLKSSYLRDLLNRFDTTVNPFMNDKLDLKPISSYLNNVKIDMNSYDVVQNRYRKNCCSMTITDKNTSNKVNYYRSPDGFAYQLECLIDNKSICISHYYDAFGNISNRGECIYITIYDYKKDELEYDRTFNITNHLVGNYYEDKTIMDYNDYEELINLLSKYILITEDITINNMTKNKKMELKNN